MAAVRTSKMMSAVFLVLSFVVTLCSAEGRTPVIAWSNRDSLSSLSGVPAGHTVTAAGLQSHYLNHFVNTPQNIVLLMQDKDSLDSSASSLTLPAVDVGEEDDNLIGYLQSHVNGQVEYLKSPDDLKDLKLLNGKTNLIILPVVTPQDEGKSKREKLSDNDQVLGQVSRFFQSLKESYTMILTSAKAEKAKAVDTLKRVRREASHGHVAASSNSTYIFINASCVLLFASKMSFVMNDTNQNIHVHIDLTDLPFITDVDCSEENRTLSVVFEYSEGDSISLNLTMKMIFNNDKKMWTTDLFTIQYVYTNGSMTVRKTDKQASEYIRAPIGKSYHCDNPPDKDKDENTTAIIEFVKLQVQPYNITMNGFSSADDCVGYFTAEIWMVLMAVLLFLLILSFGLVFLLNITSMDRFDDPKGKQLMITTDE
ncbi:V-type proton ATPase subunit S1-like isoform X2 [Ptychodera flava]|uniref:V-type proton ATPase subunit S1-like isoform X2 n=1 Tax=Ptychodera flava TaxID=63121 RepID=UPI003969CBFA